jgi:phosphoglycolate phosphatase
LSQATVALLFDIDGTLIDSGGVGGSALLKALGAEFSLSEAQPVPLHGRTDLGIFTELLEKHGIFPSKIELNRLCEHYFRLLPLELAARPGRVLPGVHEVLEHVVSREDCLVGVLTGNMPTSAQAKLSHYHLDRYFSFGIYGDEAATRPELRGPALKRVHAHLGRELASNRIVIIGDTPLDVELAKAMGARCLAVCTGGIEASDLQAAGADLVVEDLSDTERIIDWCFPSEDIFI